MEAYVKVGNDLQLAVKNIILSKKAFLKQSRCIKALSEQNELLQQKVNDLEMNNKELRALSLLVKQNQSLKKEMSELEGKLRKKNRVHVLNEILACDTVVSSEVTTSPENTTSSSDVNSTEVVLNEILACDTVVSSEVATSSSENSTSSSDVNSTEDEEDVEMCPLSPTKRKRKDQNKDCTPSITKKKIQQRNKSQSDSGGAVEGETVVSAPRRSSRVQKKNNSNK